MFTNPESTNPEVFHKNKCCYYSTINKVTKPHKIYDSWNLICSMGQNFQVVRNTFVKDLIFSLISSNYFPKTVASTYNRESNIPNFEDGLAQSVLIYDPRCREQIWRFFTYMFLHGNPIHLGFNLALQILVGKFMQ